MRPRFISHSNRIAPRVLNKNNQNHLCYHHCLIVIIDGEKEDGDQDGSTWQATI